MKRYEEHRWAPGSGSMTGSLYAASLGPFSAFLLSYHTGSPGQLVLAPGTPPSPGPQPAAPILVTGSCLFLAPAKGKHQGWVSLSHWPTSHRCLPKEGVSQRVGGGGSEESGQACHTIPQSPRARPSSSTHQRQGTNSSTDDQPGVAQVQRSNQSTEVP